MTTFSYALYMKILAIETSCDETAISVVEGNGSLKSPSFKIKTHEVSSQVKLHEPFGGVVPMLAKREHNKNLPTIFNKVIKKHKDVDLLAVTVGPGLEPALWEGINFAKEVSRELKKPLIGVNHLEGHIYSNWFKVKKPKFPSVCLIVSGGHTSLLLMESITKWTILGETRDDAVGEAFDKVARMLHLKYPGGPEIEKLAKEGKPNIEFPRPMIHEKNYDFSFSGLKTSVLYYIRDKKRIMKKNVAASFQESAIEVLVKKTIKASEEYKAKSILLCGGVAGNSALRKSLEKESKKIKTEFFAPTMKLNTDNASMIAAAAYINDQNPKAKKLKLEANGNLSV